MFVSVWLGKSLSLLSCDFSKAHIYRQGVLMEQHWCFSNCNCWSLIRDWELQWHLHAPWARQPAVSLSGKNVQIQCPIQPIPLKEGRKRWLAASEIGLCVAQVDCDPPGWGSWCVNAGPCSRCRREGFSGGILGRKSLCIGEGQADCCIPTRSDCEEHTV